MKGFPALNYVVGSIGRPWGAEILPQPLTYWDFGGSLLPYLLFDFLSEVLYARIRTKYTRLRSSGDVVQTLRSASDKANIRLFMYVVQDGRPPPQHLNTS